MLVLGVLGVALTENRVFFYVGFYCIALLVFYGSCGTVWFYVHFTVLHFNTGVFTLFSQPHQLSACMAGIPGMPGKPGESGPAGRDGRDGRNGLNGAPGKVGPRALRDHRGLKESLVQARTVLLERREIGVLQVLKEKRGRKVVWDAQE